MATGTSDVLPPAPVTVAVASRAVKVSEPALKMAAALVMLVAAAAVYEMKLLSTTTPLLAREMISPDTVAGASPAMRMVDPRTSVLPDAVTSWVPSINTACDDGAGVAAVYEIVWPSTTTPLLATLTVWLPTVRAAPPAESVLEPMTRVLPPRVNV